ncbi:MAG: putative acylesterase/phospholipase RssA [Myxococcota bacterium]|jgi:predicted acylesterase/phospholipase RssA
MHVCLSSGFLAFAEQAGFLAGLEDAGVRPTAVVGTSSGALAGACLAAGWSADRVFAELTARRPLAFVRPSLAPWSGLLDLAPMVRHLRTLLPPTFADLERPLAVGVLGPQGHALLTDGPLPEAVAASCAIPWVFRPVRVGGVDWADGGAGDRTGLAAWRSAHPDAEIVLHLLDRSHNRDRPDPREPTPELLAGLTVVRSPRSDAQLWSLGDVVSRRDAARERTRAALVG